MIITTQSGAVRLQSGKTSMFIDPQSRRFSSADVVVNTVYPPAIDAEGGSGGGAFWIEHAGEYEIKGIRIRGWQVGAEEDRESIVYLIAFENINFAVLGSIDILPPEAVEHMQDIDISIVSPAGSGEKLARLARQIEPGMIAMLSRSAGSRTAGGGKGIKLFLDEFGVGRCRKEDKIVLRKNDIREGAMEIRCLYG